ncbi:MAG: MFS transporter [Bacillota bacterium]
MNKKQQLKIDWSYLLLLSTAYFATSINMQGIQALMPFIQSDFQLSRTQAGFYSTFFFVSATLMAVFSGKIVDKYGARKGMLIGVFSVGIMMFLHSFAPVYSVLLILGLICGFGFSIVTPSVNKAVIEGVHYSKRAISMGIMQSGGGIGGFAGASLLPIFANSFGWRRAIGLSGIIAVIVGIVIVIFLNDRSQQSEAKDISFYNKIKELLSNKHLFFLCLLGLGFGTAIGAIPAHFALYLTLDLDFSTTLAGFSLGVLQIGGIAGRSFWGLISDSFYDGERNPALKLMVIMIIFMVFFFGLFVWRFTDSRLMILLFSFLLGMSGMGWMGLYFTFIGETSGSEDAGVATGLALIFIRTGVIFSPPLFGLLADFTDNYNLSWLALGLVISLVSFIYFYQVNKLEIAN